MRIRFLLPLAVAMIAAVPACAQDYPPPDGYAQSGYDTDGQSVDSIAVFFEPLSHFGRWVDSRFGRAWTPNVNRDWRPYTIGHWEQGPYGQTWRSDEPFGWAVFHFGRWGFDPSIGWVWTPDTVWGPGWVAWRDSDDVTGWAPLPPRVSLSLSFGAAYGDGFNSWGYDQWYQPSWVYVPRGYLYGRSLRGAILPYARNREFWAGTRGITHYDRVDGRVVNRSFDGSPRGEAVRQGGGRRVEVRPQGGVPQSGSQQGDLRSTYQPRDYGRDQTGAPPAPVPYPGRDYRREGFVPVQPQRQPGFGGGRPPPAMLAPNAAAVRPQAAAPRPQPQAQPPAPRPAPRPNQQREPNPNERPK